MYHDEWTVVIPPTSVGAFGLMAQIIGHGTTATLAWHDAHKKTRSRIFAIPGTASSKHYEERKPTFPCTVFAQAINGGAGTPCPDKKTFQRISDYCFPSCWQPA